MSSNTNALLIMASTQIFSSSAANNWHEQNNVNEINIDELNLQMQQDSSYRQEFRMSYASENYNDSSEMDELTKEQLNTLKFDEAFSIFRNVILFVICLFFPLSKRDQLKQCGTPHFTWLIVTSVIHLLYALRSLIFLVIILQLKKRSF